MLHIFVKMITKELLNDILQCCEKRFGHGSAEYWRQRDFNELSREIKRETKVSISLSTLKRIFGKTLMDDDYIPQQATLEALKNYCGYVVADKPDHSQNGNQSIKKKPNGIFLKVSVFILMISGILIWQIIKPTPASIANIRLKTMEGLLPSTAIFDMDIPNSSDSLFIDFGDKSALTYVKAGQKRITHNYFLPGVFDVVLKTKNQVLSTAKVVVYSDKWIGMGFHRQRDLPDHYYEFPAVKTGRDSLFHISNDQLHGVGLDTTSSNYTRLCRYSSVLSGGDDFDFETTFKNAMSDKGIYCHSVQLKVAGLNGIIRFQLVSPGCSSQVFNIISEQTFQGGENDLSQFVIDLKKWNTVKIINREKHLILLVNNKQIYAGDYHRSIGYLQGLSVEFEGTGFVKSCDLTSLDGKKLYHF